MCVSFVCFSDIYCIPGAAAFDRGARPPSSSRRPIPWCALPPLAPTMTRTAPESRTHSRPDSDPYKRMIGIEQISLYEADALHTRGGPSASATFALNLRSVDGSDSRPSTHAPVDTRYRNWAFLKDCI